MPAPRRSGARRLIAPAALAALATASATAPAALAAQMPDDGFLFPHRQLRVGVEYGRAQWSEYWEGTLRRTNDNLGTLTTRSAATTLGYGATRRLSLFAALPYVWTRASAGVQQGLSGPQDATLTAKYRVTRTRLGGRATLGTFAAAAVGLPTSNYAVDFLPLSIGLGSRRATGRAVAHLQDRSGLYVEGTGAYTWRGNVRLDRPAYYTNGRLYSTNEVEMPNVAEYAVAGGYQKGRICVPVAFVTQRTRGGGDIRRQDMPFVSNRMDFTALRAHAMYDLRLPQSVILDVGATRTLSGRNVGRSTALVAGVAYAFGRPGF